MSLPTAQEVWWERLKRAMRDQRVSAQWAHRLLGVRARSTTLEVHDEHGARFEPNPWRDADDATIANVEAQLCDELGEALGVGPMPR